jgi:diguanylate cyclase (GGDEF)-like protein/PAS domain S-box-containing protein
VSPRAAVKTPELILIGTGIMVLLVGARLIGAAAPVPVPILAGAILAGFVVAGLAGLIETESLTGVILRVAANMGSVLVITYATGWGSVLVGIGFVFTAAQHTAVIGPKATRPAMIASLVAVALGELAVHLDIAPTMLDHGRSHGIAALSAVGALALITLLDAAARDRDDATRAIASSEQRLARLLADAADGLVVINAEHKLVFASEGMARLTGLSLSELVEHRDLRSIMHHEDVHRGIEQLGAVVSGRRRTITTDLRILHRDGTVAWCEVTATNHLDDPLIRGVVIDVHDVTARKSYEQLLAGEARVLEMIAWAEPVETILDALARLIEQHIPGSLCVIRMLDGDVMRLVAAPSVPPEVALRIRELPARETGRYRAAYHAQGVAMSSLLGGDMHEAVAAAQSAGYGSCWPLPIEVPHRNAMVGHLTLVMPNERVPSGADRQLLERLCALAAVAIEQTSARAELEHRAFHDELTGLPKRIAFNDRLQHALARAHRNDQAVAVLYLDLDRFKVVNDGLGHDAGDRLLLQVAQRLQARLRASDMVARLGGDEFAVLIDDARSDVDIELATQRVRDALADPFELDGQKVYVTASVGVAVARSMEEGEHLLQGADDAMYRAKRRGRGTVEVQTAIATQLAAGRLSRLTALHHAVERDEFVVHYQPIVEIPGRHPVCVEALVRWEHPELGLLPPGEFIPLAEDSGLIVAIGRRVLEHAVERLRWSPLGVAVNVSARQLNEESFVATLAGLVADVDASRLTLEITESSLIEDTGVVSERLHAIHALGVRLALDDFGTGYSSLTHLSRMPIDQLKIDRSFVAGMEQREDDFTLVKGLISMASALGIEVVAEGVENATQMAMLVELDCPLAQGYFFQRPAPASPPHEYRAVHALRH